MQDIPEYLLDVKLSINVTIGKYKMLERKRDREEIAKFIKERFTERYIDLMREGKPHGFCIMAVCCLMIEAIESFRQGWENSHRKSPSAFSFFFDKNDEFADFRGHPQEFYKHVRCGILHQGETSGGWRIRRKGDLFDQQEKIINATKFLDALENGLESYCDELRRAKWDENIWCKLRDKMKQIIKNCKRD